MTLVYTRSLSVSHRQLTNQVVVYLLDCKRFTHLVDNFKSLLSGEELNRAYRYHNQLSWQPFYCATWDYTANFGVSSSDSS